MTIEEAVEEMQRIEIAAKARRAIALEQARSAHARECADVEEDYSREFEQALKAMIEKLTS